MANQEEFDQDQFLLVKLITGEEIFVTDMFEPGDILEESTKTVIVQNPFRVMLREDEGGSIFLSFTPWMYASSEHDFPISKSAIMSYAPIQERFAKFYKEFLVKFAGAEGGAAEKKLEDEPVNKGADSSDIDFLKKVKDTRKKRK